MFRVGHGSLSSPCFDSWRCRCGCSSRASVPAAISCSRTSPFASSSPPWRLGDALSSGPPTEPSGSPFDSCGLAGRTPSSSSSLRQSSVGTVLTSGCTGGGCPAAVTGEVAVAREVRHLIRRMATENLWRAPRIHGELLRLGFKVSERSVSRYLRTLLRRPERRQTWMTFLRNHREVFAAMDFFTVPTATFRIFYVLFVIRYRRREILHWDLTAHPTASWVMQQLREAFPFHTAAKYLVFDRDSSFSAELVTVVRSMGLEPTRISYRSPWQRRGRAVRRHAPPRATRPHHRVERPAFSSPSLRICRVLQVGVTVLHLGMWLKSPGRVA